MAYTEHRSTARVISILKLLAENQEGYTLSRIASLLDVPKGSIFPILQTLKENHFLKYDEQSGIYQTGIMAFRVGMSYINRGDHFKYVQEVLSGVVDQCREAAHFGVLEEGKVVYLLKIDSPQAVRMIANVGKSLPAYATGVGKALLIDCSLTELRAVYPDGLIPMTDNTITDFEALYKQLQSFQADDIAYEYEESNKDIQCIAVAIRVQGRIQAGVSVAIPVFRCSEEKLDEIRSMLLETKRVLEDYFSHMVFDWR